MRERDMESVMKNDDLKVSLYGSTRESGSLPIRSSKAIRKRRWRTCIVIWTKRGKLSISCFSTFRNAPQRGGGLYCCRDGLHFRPAQGGQHRHAEFPAVYQGSGRGAGRQEELQPERDLAVLEHGGQEGAEGPV